MEITELRVGNLLYMNVTDGWVIRPIKVNEFLALYKHPEWAKPIPLSEEILLKVGFVECEKERLYISVSLGRLSYVKGLNCVFLLGYQNKILGNVVRELHQLQNLYFALTGSELNTSGL